MKESFLEGNIFQDTTESENPVKRQQMEAVVGGEDDSVKRTFETLHSAINHDESITESKLNDLRTAIEGMKINIGGKEVALKAVERISSFNVSLNDLYKSWGLAETDLPIPNPTFVDPKEITYEERLNNIDKKNFGTYTLNPETFAGDFEKAKVFIPDLSAMADEKLPKVFQYVVDTYGDKYNIPGIEYWKWMIENPDKAQVSAQKHGYDINDDFYFFPGSIFCDPDGNWSVPYIYWIGGGFDRSSRWLELDWHSGFQVLLLEK